MNIKDYLFAAVILVLLFFLGREMIQHRKDVKVRDSQIANQQTYIDSLVASKTKETIIHDTVTKYVTKYKTKYSSVDSILVYKIIAGRQSDFAQGDFDTTAIYKRLYLDTLKTEDFELPYRVSLWGDLDFVGFDKYKVFTKEKVIEHVVNVPVDVVREIDKSHLYLYFMFGSAWALDNSYSYEGGLNLVIKNRFGIMGGYQRYEKINFIKFGFNFKLL